VFAGDTIRLVVPFAPGTTIDIVAKILQQDLSARLHKPIVIENKAGAGGAIGSKFVATTDSTDTVLLINSSGLAVNTAFADTDYNIENLTPLVNLGSAPVVLVTSSKSNIRNFKDLLKSNDVTLGNSGPNSLTFLISEALKKDIDKNLIPVPYKGVNLAIPDLLSGNLDGAFLFYTSSLPYPETKKLIPIAVMSDSRLPELPKTPTFRELNVTALDPIDPWFAIFSNAKADPKEIEIVKITLINSLRDPKVVAALRNNGITVTKKPSLPSDFLINEHTKYQKIIQKLGLPKG
jgi:tripartite-type tricarboxylate transporter receptor subunit TctC